MLFKLSNVHFQGVFLELDKLGIHILPVCVNRSPHLSHVQHELIWVSRVKLLVTVSWKVRQWSCCGKLHNHHQIFAFMYDCGDCHRFEIHFFGYPSGPQNELRQKSRVCHGFIPFEHVDLYQGAGFRTALVTEVGCRGPASHSLSLSKSLFHFTFISELGFVLCFSCLFSSLAYFFPLISHCFSALWGCY